MTRNARELEITESQPMFLYRVVGRLCACAVGRCLKVSKFSVHASRAFGFQAPTFCQELWRKVIHFPMTDLTSELNHCGVPRREGGATGRTLMLPRNSAVGKRGH